MASMVKQAPERGLPQMAAAPGGPSGAPAKMGERHAFVHERVLVLIAMATRAGGEAKLTKGDLAQKLGVHVCSIDRAVKRLRAEGDIESIACYSAQGAQLANAYRATPQGLARADALIARVFAVSA